MALYYLRYLCHFLRSQDLSYNSKSTGSKNWTFASLCFKLNKLSKLPCIWEWIQIKKLYENCSLHYAGRTDWGSFLSSACLPGAVILTVTDGLNTDAKEGRASGRSVGQTASWKVDCLACWRDRTPAPYPAHDRYVELL